MPTRCETCVVSIVLRSAGGRQLDIGVLPIGFESGGIGRQRLTPMTVLPSKTTPSRMISIGASGQGRSRRIHRPPARNTVPQAIQKPLSFRSICQRANSAVRMRAPTPRRNHPQGTSASIEIPTQMKKTAHATESSCWAWSLVSVDDLGPKAGCVLVIALSLFQKRAIAVRALTCVNSGIGNTGLGPSESPRTKFAAAYRLWILKRTSAASQFDIFRALALEPLIVMRVASALPRQCSSGAKLDRPVEIEPSERGCG